MYLKKIEIAGFKSFADRTVIEFDTGLTAVVGPNGSGKSNITEAIRWVLGEQSAKNLRGGKMPDVIFAGSTTRKALNIAEVTVVLDNEERFLPLDFSEVSVTRRLNRSGDSDFFINKQSCRLKDIIDLFMDSGLGKESFSIISQGKVEAIFNSKPEDRRGIFEEAAGVLKYKQRKRKAEQKLFETEDNLNRVQDIIYELENQLEPLKEQSAVAQKYLLLKEQLTEVDVSVTVAEIEQLKAQWAEKNLEVQELEATIRKIQEKIKNLDEKMFTLREQRAQLDQQLDTEQQTLLTVTEAYEQAEGQRNVLLERSKNTAKTSAEYTENLAQATNKVEQIALELAQLEQALAEKQVEKNSFDVQVTEFSAEVVKYSKSTKEQIAELRSQYVEIMQAQANVGNDLKHLERQYQQETSKNQQAMSQYEQLIDRQEGLAEKATTAETSLTRQTEKLVELRTSYSTQQQTVERMQQQLSLKEKQMYDAMGVLQQAKARQKSLQELQENYAGFYQGVRAVLKEKNQLIGIIGAVAELIQVPKEFAVGIETALGGAAQNVIVQDENSGRQAITYLKQQRLGRATFLPVTTIKPRVLPQNIRGQLSGIDGFMGIASEVVTYEEQVGTVIQNLLGFTILARNLQAANQIAKQVRYQYRVVSLEGDVMNPGGSMTGGANKKGNQGSLFSQGNELQTITDKLKEMNLELEKRETYVRELKAGTQEAVEALEITREAGENARLKEQELKNILEIIESENRQLKRERQAFEYDSKELQSFLKEYETKKVELNAALAEYQSERERLDVAMNQTDQTESLNTEKREAVQEKLNAAQAQVAVVLEQTNHLQQLITDKQGQLHEAQAQVQHLQSQIEVLTGDSSLHAESHESISEKMTEWQEKKSQLQSNLSELKEKREAVHSEIAEVDSSLVSQHQQLQVETNKKTKSEVVKSRAELGLDNALQHLQEDYSLTYEAGKEQYPLEIEIADAKLKVREIKQTIDRLGPVNMSAIEQFEEVDERYTFLVVQRDDLLEAKDSLFDTMNEMDEVVKEKFSEVFDAISLKFTKVFPQMFGGGHAELRLTDPLDLLNTGIEIVAQPPGKKLQSLSLLSGGERALTAIALLFSIIQVRPVPFCVLDEVEAALDEANVARFGSYLSKFENDTQFIVITHRKGTMEAADVLYGVTMQESGVSKIVSVRLEEINERGDIEKASGA